MSRMIEYNLPGHGFTNCYLFDTASKLVDLLNQKGLIDKMKNIYQLGTMKYVYPGAHHTRYEYVFTQLLLISNLAVYKGNKERNIEISLGSDLKEYKDVKATGSDIMQCLAILSNAGHMYDTFTASKILLRLLQRSKENKTEFFLIYRSNLPKEVRAAFDSMLENSNYYKLHLFNMMHLITGMVRKEEYRKICEFSLWLLKGLVNTDLIEYESTKRIFFLYKKVRKIAYLSVDMIYTPASFGINLNRMIYSFPTYIDELFDEDSVINKSISQLEDMIHKQIYDSAKCILNTTRIEQEEFEKYEILVGKIKNVFEIRKLLLEIEEKEYNLHSKRQPEMVRNIIAGSELLVSADASKDTLRGLLERDDVILKKIPFSRIAYGSQISQNLHTVFSAFGVSSKEHLCADVQTIIKEIIQNKLYGECEKKDLVKYAIKSLYKYNDFFFTLSEVAGYNINDCVFIGRGCKNVAKQIRNVFNAKNVKKADNLHEILSCAEVLESISYSGLVMCFVGSIKASKYNETQKIDELDGFIYFPNKSAKTKDAIIIEAKNYSKGESEAIKQLEETKSFLSETVTTKIEKKSKYAYLTLEISK